MVGDSWEPPEEEEGEGEEFELGEEVADILAGTFREIIADMLPKVAASRSASKDKELMVADHLTALLQKLRDWLVGEFDRLKKSGQAALPQRELMPLLGRFLSQLTPDELGVNPEQARFEF